MKIINHIIDCQPISTSLATDNEFWDKEDAWFDNRNEPVVRVGGEPFESHYLVETFRESIIVDPSRSYIGPLYARLKESPVGYFEVVDSLSCLLYDIGIGVRADDLASRLAFHTMFPRIAADYLAQSYLRDKRFEPVQREIPRVVNNPFFHADSHASEKQLLEIAQHNGCTYVVDMSVDIPAAEVLAHEIALVNHVEGGNAAVAAAEKVILEQVKTVL